MFRPVDAGHGKRTNADGFAIARLIVVAELLLALLRWPYSYYRILRWAVCIIASYGAFRTFDMGRRTWAWIFVALAVLFNPIAPIYFARATWNLLDALAAIVLLLSVVGPRRGRGSAVLSLIPQPPPFPKCPHSPHVPLLRIA